MIVDYIKTWIHIKSIEFFLGIKRSYSIERNNLSRYLKDLINLSSEIDKLKEEFNIRISFCLVDTSNFYPDISIVTNIREELEQDNRVRDILIDKLDSDSVIDFKLLHNTGYYFQVYYLMCMFGYEYIDDVEQIEMNKLIPLKYEKYYFHNNKYRLLDLSTYHSMFFYND